MGAGRGAMRKGGMGGEDVRKQAVVGESRQCTDLKAVLSTGKWRFKTEEGLGALPFHGLILFRRLFWKLFRIIENSARLSEVCLQFQSEVNSLCILCK